MMDRQSTLSELWAEVWARGLALHVFQSDEGVFTASLVDERAGDLRLGVAASPEEALVNALAEVRQAATAGQSDDFGAAVAIAPLKSSARHWSERRWMALAKLTGDDENICRRVVEDLETIILRCPDARLRQLCYEDIQRIALHTIE